MSINSDIDNDSDDVRNTACWTRDMEFTYGPNPDAKVFLNGRGFSDFSSYKDHKIKLQQLGVATYFIDRLALRVGNSKDETAEADTVGCTTLRVEHIKCLGERGERKKFFRTMFIN